MPDQIPVACAGIQIDIDNMRSDLAEFQEELRTDPDINKQLLADWINKLGLQIAQAEVELATCIANNPPPPPPPPPPPAECMYIQYNIDNMRNDLAELQFTLAHDADVNKELYAEAINKLGLQIAEAENAFQYCIDHPPKAAPKATMPTINSDTTLKPVQKVISWSHLQNKFDELLNNRTDPPILAARVHNHVHFNNNGDIDDQPATDITISKLEAEVENGEVIAKYSKIKTIDLGLLPGGYYIDDLNLAFINVAVDPSLPEPINVKIVFECQGAEEIKSTILLAPNFDLIVLEASFKLSFDVLRTPKSVPPECIGMLSDLNNLQSDLEELKRDVGNNNVNQVLLAEGIRELDLQILQANNDLATCVTTYGGPDPNEVGRLDFLSWIGKISHLTDDALDEAIKQYIIIHVDTGDPTLDGIFQKQARSAVYNSLKNPSIGAALSSLASNWILGGTGVYDVESVVNDGQNITINYLVPANKLDPFPDSMFRPTDWPYFDNPNPNPDIDFSIPHNLSKINHIVVLTMENRSFDHMLGYLSLPESAGGMGRTDVDGLKGIESNSFETDNYPAFAHHIGDTAFPNDPNHSYEPVFRQINADLDSEGNAIPGTGKMDGFVKSMVLDKLIGGPLGAIMGYQPAANVPVYDVLVRDFGISDRWFASHPGPTFTNRFYELTGRLNLASGLNKDTPPLLENTWEFSNSSPLTPVFTKTIFDHLTEQNVSWKYYEHAYCFLRFFSNYTFDDKNVVDANDPVKGFFTDAKNGTLPSVSFIDPHFIELPPNSNCDGPVADIKEGQALVQKIVEAVVTSPQFKHTLLIITYDEHGGFYDHVPPPAAVPFSNESPVKTYGVRVPALFVSPWVKAGSVFGHNGTEEIVHFDHTSILKTIARRFMSKNPPYMGARYAAANDLTPILSQAIRRSRFLPFVGYNLVYIPPVMRLNAEGGNSTGLITARFNPDQTNDQKFSFEQYEGFVYIRTNCSNLYLTVDIPDSGNTIPPADGFGIKQDVKYEGAQALIDPVKFNISYQLWKFTPLDATEAGKNAFIITNAFFPTLILRPLDISQNATPIILGNKATDYPAPNTWAVSSPLIN